MANEYLDKEGLKRLVGLLKDKIPDLEVKENGDIYAGGKKVLREGDVSGGGTKLYKHIFTYPQYSGEQITFLSLQAEKFKSAAELHNANSSGLIVRAYAWEVLAGGAVITFVGDDENYGNFKLIVFDSQTGAIAPSALSFELPDDENYTVVEV